MPPFVTVQVSIDELNLLVTLTFWMKHDLMTLRLEDGSWPDENNMSGLTRFDRANHEVWAPSAGQKRTGKNDNPHESFDGLSGLVYLLTNPKKTVTEGPWTVFSVPCANGQTGFKVRGYARLHNER